MHSEKSKTIYQFTVECHQAVFGATNHLLEVSRVSPHDGQPQDRVGKDLVTHPAELRNSKKESYKKSAMC
jgi:hypothetical protein